MSETVKSCGNCFEHTYFGCGGKGQWNEDGAKKCWIDNPRTLQTEVERFSDSLKKILKLTRQASLWETNPAIKEWLRRITQLAESCLHENRKGDEGK